jgi:iron complex outermembrane receptor protein
MELENDRKAKVLSRTMLKMLGSTMLVLPALFTATSAMAAAAEAAGEAEAGRSGLSEIVVTAQKRETNLQKTPIAIAVQSALDLENRRIKSLNDFMDGSIPSLRVAQFARRNSALTIGIRGIFPSTDTNQPARDATIGVYIDGVYLGRPQGLSAALYDVERIEVLKGPQGTLFGRNAVGGALNIVTREPAGEFKMRLTAGVRNFGGHSAEAHIDFPEIAGVAIKLDALVSKRNGTVSNPASGQLGFNSYDRRGLAIRAKWSPAEDLTFDYGFDIGHDESTPSWLQLLAAPATAVLSPLVAVSPTRMSTADIGVPIQPSVGDQSGHRLTVKWKLSDAIELRSITAYRMIDQNQYDNSAGAHTVAFVANGKFARYSLAWMDQDQFIQELQLVGEAGRLKYVAGLFLFRETGGDSAWAPDTLLWNATGSAYTILPSFEAGAQSPFPDRESTARATSKAAYLQLDWNPDFLGDRLHLTAGLRYTQDKKDGVLVKVNGFNDGATFNFSSSRVDPAFSVQFDVAKDVHLYGKWGSAYRAGGANSRSLTYATFGPEVVNSAEIGLKSEFFERRVRLNLAGFRTDYKSMQVDFNRNAIVAGSNRTVNETVNVPGVAKIKGFEADIALAPFDGLTLNAGYAYTEWTIPSAINPFNNAVTPLSMVNTPKNAFSASFDYTLSLKSLDVLFHIDVAMADGYNSGSNVVTSPITDASTHVNARLALTNIQLGDGHTLELSAWSRNLFNEQHLTAQSLNSTTRFLTGAFNDPRSFGLDVTLRY